MSDMPYTFDYNGIRMLLCKWRLVMCLRGLVAVTTILAYAVLGSSISLAQYPGSAGNLNNGAFGVSSSASSNSSSEASSLSGTLNSDETSNSSAISSINSSDSDASGDGFDGGGGGDGGRTVTVLPPIKEVRKRSLIRQFRLEFSKTLTVETANKRPFRALSANVYLDKFSKELDAGFDQQADLDSLSRDLHLVRDALDDRLDEVIANYGGDTPRHNFFFKNSSVGRSAPDLRAEVQKLKLKHELLEFGEFSLQAMGYYAK